MNEHEIVQELSETRNPRAKIYLNRERIDSLYSQSVSAINELVTSGKLGLEASANLLSIFQSRIATDRGLEGTISISSELKAILIEQQEKRLDKLVDLSSDEARKGVLLKYIGNGRIVRIDKDVSAEVPALPSSIAQTIQRERMEQENGLRKKDDKIRTIVWMTSIRSQILASIASSDADSIDHNHLLSYHDQPPFGILGRYEKRISDVIFISPLWIWHDGW